MRNAKKVLLTLVLVAFVFTAAGCGSKKDDSKAESNTASKSSFKNGKEVVATKGDKGTVKVTYENDGSFEESTAGDSIVLRNPDGNFRMYFEFTTRNIATLEKLIESYKKSDSWVVTEDLKFGGYKGFAFTGANTGTTEVYLIIDKEKEIVLDAKVSPVMTSKATEAIKGGTKAVDVLYGQDKVQQVLKSITYTK